MIKETPVQSPLKTRLDLTETMFLSLTLQIQTNVEEWHENSGEQLILTTKVSMSREEKAEQDSNYESPLLALCNAEPDPEPTHFTDEADEAP